MELLLDTGNLHEIERCCAQYAVAGVTTNPSIMSKESADFFELLRAIRGVIGREATLHVQTVGASTQEILRDADTLLDRVGSDTYIKIPTTAQGLTAMKQLKERGVHVTATAVYSVSQALMAASVGADYIAPYFNRICNFGADGAAEIARMAELYRVQGCKTKIVAASFKNIGQVIEALLAGAQAVTVPGELLDQMTANPAIEQAVKNFRADWDGRHGGRAICEL